MQLQTVLGYSFIYDMIFIAVFKNKHNYYEPSISTPLPSEKLCMRTFILFPSVIATLSARFVQDRTRYKQYLQDLDHYGVAITEGNKIKGHMHNFSLGRGVEIEGV